MNVASERQLSPFYTVLLGPEPVPEIESLPTERPIPWRDADETFLNLADYINERAGQIFPGEAEYVVTTASWVLTFLVAKLTLTCRRFNSLLVAVTPPGMSSTQAPVRQPRHLVRCLRVANER